jgi:uncharacterized protein DUF6867
MEVSMRSVNSIPVAGPPATAVQSGKPQRDFAMAALLGTSVGVFVGLTVIIAGGAAIMTGRALADGWKAPWQVVLASFGLTLAERFLVYALFDGDLLSPSGFLIDFVVLTALALLAYRVTLVRKMVSQYPWRYERTSLFKYRERPGRA